MCYQLLESRLMVVLPHLLPPQLSMPTRFPQVKLLEMRHQAYDMSSESYRLAEEASWLKREAFRLELSIDDDDNFGYCL